jgi:hypothetical protein
MCQRISPLFMSIAGFCAALILLINRTEKCHPTYQARSSHYDYCVYASSSVMRLQVFSAPVTQTRMAVAIRVLQLKFPLACKYWFVYQKVQSSTGSILMLL